MLRKSGGAGDGRTGWRYATLFCVLVAVTSIRFLTTHQIYWMVKGQDPLLRGRISQQSGALLYDAHQLKELGGRAG